jgi:gamma-glutamylcyclotransferase (GGCT)/AIG2-like uncharacterized protein YtfP
VILEANSYYTVPDKIFFVKAGVFNEDSVFYHVEIDNSKTITKIDEVINNESLYYKIKTHGTGVGKVTIYRYNITSDNQSQVPVKTIKVVVK